MSNVRLCPTHRIAWESTNENFCPLCQAKGITQPMELIPVRYSAGSGRQNAATYYLMLVIENDSDIYSEAHAKVKEAIAGITDDADAVEKIALAFKQYIEDAVAEATEDSTSRDMPIVTELTSVALDNVQWTLIAEGEIEYMKASGDWPVNGGA